MERFPQLDVLDLRHYHIPAGTLEGLKSNPAQKFYLPQKLKMLWGKYDYPEQISIYPVELCKELVGRGLNLETLFIYCGDMNDERMKTLIEMIEQNHRNGGILSAVHFCSTMGFPPHADVSEKLKSDLLNALTESKIVLDGWIVKELDRPVGVSPEKSQ